MKRLDQLIGERVEAIGSSAGSNDGGAALTEKNRCGLTYAGRRAGHPNHFVVEFL